GPPTGGWHSPTPSATPAQPATDWTAAAPQPQQARSGWAWGEPVEPAPEPRFEARNADQPTASARSSGGRRSVGTVLAAALLSAVLASGSTVAIVSLV